MSDVIEQDISEILARYKGVHQTNIRALADAAKLDARITRIDPKNVLAAIEDLATATGEPLSDAKSAVDNIITSLGRDSTPKSHQIKSGDVLRSVQQESSWLKRTSDRLHALPTEQKINASMWGVGALLGAFGFARSVSHSLKKDEQGENHVQWSNVSVALLQAVMTALCTYMGVQAVRAGAGR